MADNTYYMMCGYMGNNVCLRMPDSTPDNDMFTCDVTQAKLFTLVEVIKWMSLSAKSGKKNRPIPARIVENNIRRVFSIEHAAEPDRIALFRFWKSAGLDHRNIN